MLIYLYIDAYTYVYTFIYVYTYVGVQAYRFVFMYLHQAFSSAAAFNANVAMWNTVSVTSLSQVCAAFGLRVPRPIGLRCGLAVVYIMRQRAREGGLDRFGCRLDVDILHTQAFDGVGMADCIKRGVYNAWGVTLRTAYPTWSSLSPVCATPAPATPRYRVLCRPLPVAVTSVLLALGVPTWPPCTVRRC
jgi:hypothetical protein